MGKIEHSLSDYNEITAIGFVIADLVYWHFSACIGFWDIRGDLEVKINTHSSNGAVYALCMT